MRTHSLSKRETACQNGDVPSRPCVPVPQPAHRARDRPRRPTRGSERRSPGRRRRARRAHRSDAYGGSRLHAPARCRLSRDAIDDEHPACADPRPHCPPRRRPMAVPLRSVRASRLPLRPRRRLRRGDVRRRFAHGRMAGHAAVAGACRANRSDGLASSTLLPRGSSSIIPRLAPSWVGT